MKHNTESLLVGALETIGKVVDKIDLCINSNSTFDNERELATGTQKKTFRQLKGDCISAIDDLKVEFDHIIENRSNKKRKKENNMKHTKGPWEVEGKSPNGTFTIRANKGTKDIAWVNDHFNEKDDGKPDANLIALAPEMLEALIDIAQRVDGHFNGRELRVFDWKETAEEVASILFRVNGSTDYSLAEKTVTWKGRLANFRAKAKSEGSE